MAADPAAMVLDMLADTIDAMNQGRSADATLLEHLSTALEADCSASVYVDPDGQLETVGAYPSQAGAAALLAHVHSLEPGLLRHHVSIQVVPHLGHVVLIHIRPPEDPEEQPGFGRVIAFARPRPYDELARRTLERACRPVALLWPSSAKAFARNRIEMTDFNITDRELQVLDLLAQGLLATSIASRLNLSPRTVHKHLGNIYRKLGVHDRLVAVGVARAHGLLPERPSRPAAQAPRPASEALRPASTHPSRQPVTTVTSPGRPGLRTPARPGAR